MYRLTNKMAENPFFKEIMLADFNPNPIMASDGQGEILFFNKAAEKQGLVIDEYRRLVPELWREQLGTGKFREKTFLYHHNEHAYLIKLFKSSSLFYFICHDQSFELFANSLIKQTDIKYKLLAEFSNECIICHDESGIIKFATASVYSILGYSPEELINSDIQKYIIEHDSIIKMKKEILKSQQTEGRILLSLKLKNSDEKYFEYYFNRIKINANENELIVHLKDISEKDELEKKSQTDEWKFHLLMDVIADGILFHKNGVIYEANKSAEAIVGYTKSELKGMPIIDLTYITYKKPLLTHIIYNKEASLEIQFIRKDGHKILTEVTFKYEYLSKKNISILIIKDLTEKQEFLEKLDETEKKYEILVESTQEFIYTTDYLGNFTYLNPGGINKMGFSKKEILGLHYSQLIREDWKQKVMDFYKAQFNIKATDTYYEFPVITKAGTEFWLGQSVHTLMKDGRIVGYHAYARDITERRKAEEALLQAKQKLEDSVISKEKFISIMSHEIRTPMNAVIGITNLLLQKSNSQERIEEYLKSLKISSNNLLNILNSVLEQSKLEAGKIQVEQLSFSLNEVIDQVVDIFKYPAIDKNLKLKIDKDTHIPSLLIGDPYRLNQILVNLMSNAIKFTEKGSVHLSTEFINENNKVALIRISIADTGIGIGTKNITTIFESFTQANSNITRKYGGTGLGLSITKGIVELLGGIIKVNSSEGKGSVFSVELPFIVSEKTSEVILKSDVRDCTNLEGAKILVVEDNQMNQMITSRFLEQKKIENVIAENGLVAIELLKKNSEYDLILMDLQMPEMDGYDTAKYIRDKLKLKEIPIIAFTASSSMEIEHKILDAGMNDYIVKPFEPEVFFSLLVRYLNK